MGSQPDINALKSCLISLGSLNTDLTLHPPPDSKLCHYTSLDGAVGIIHNDDLWLSNCRFSNDDEELSYGYNVVGRVLDKAISSEPEESHKAIWLARVKKEIGKAQDVYVCCFCQKENLLSQWRGYAENGGGVSLEFDHAGFKNFTGYDSFGMVSLWKVFYDRPQQDKIVSDCIDHFCNRQQPDADQVTNLAYALDFFAPTFKSDHFREEDEWRLIFSLAGSKMAPQFRTRRGMLVPYFTLKQLTPNPPKLPISSVMVGPSAHKALNRESMQMMLDTHGHVNKSATECPIPYRG